MPLTPAAPRRPIHGRALEMTAYERDDGLFDVDAHLVDRKPFDFYARNRPSPLPAGEPLHDLSIRLTFDRDGTVRAVEAAADATPHALCREAVSTLQSMVGERIGRGWSSKVRERLSGKASCNHLMEMLLPIATTAFQGFMGIDARQPRSADEAHAATRLDACYAYDRRRELVRNFWPALHRPFDEKTAPDS